MDFKVLILAVATVAHTSADIVPVPDATFYLPLHPPPPADVEKASDALVALTQLAHDAFIRNHEVATGDQYSYGFEFFDWKTGVSQEQHEKRFWDIAYGTSSQVLPGGKRMTVRYSVDSRNGFRATVTRGVPIQKRSPGNMAPTLQELPPLPDLLLRDDASPHVMNAYKHHHIVKNFFKLEPPLQFSWGYTLKEAKTGRTRGQRETSHQDKSVGKFTMVEVDGSQATVYYTADARGFAYSIHKTPAKPYALVYTGLDF